MNVLEIFGSLVFNDKVMKTALPKDTYKSLKDTITNGVPLSPNIANIVANAMKTWAIEKGATHYCHWFQPLTGITAEKYESFVSPFGEGIIMEFSGNSLIRSESDASSFPSGGLRSTFEARGYTAWDPTSYAFIKNNVLCIPSAFYSYSGEALDKKTPLLRSMELLNKQSLRILKLFKQYNIKNVKTTVGVEQEFFLMDSQVYKRRPDLVFCNRTLFGAKPPRGQELDDHYYGILKPRISSFFKELNLELWKLGICAKTHHNEVAPSQHELACIFSTGNISADQNQIVMEMMQSIAKKYDMECILHEKPFLGVNGSGKHNNWSLATDTGENLLEPGPTPDKNYRFLLFFVAVIKAVDEYSQLLRASVASASNDHRLGAHEAPPSVVSIFVGDELETILESFEKNIGYNSVKAEQIELGISTMAHIPRDTTDRNRTSPFAFTGNKFEFRMPGSSTSISEPNIVLNTIVADVLMEFANHLETQENFETALLSLISKTIINHKRILFNGNNYSKEWIEEAKRRNLPIAPSTVEALPHLISEKSLSLFERHNILKRNELIPRCEVMYEDYVKHLNIEALTMIGMAERQIIPAIFKYENELVQLAIGKKQLNLSIALEESILKNISTLSEELQNSITKLKLSMEKSKNYSTPISMATFFKDTIIKDMASLRSVIDNLEGIVVNWPFPSYAKMLYSL